MRSLVRQLYCRTQRWQCNCHPNNGASHGTNYWSTNLKMTGSLVRQLYCRTQRWQCNCHPNNGASRGRNYANGWKKATTA